MKDGRNAWVSVGLAAGLALVMATRLQAQAVEAKAAEPAPAKFTTEALFGRAKWLLAPETRQRFGPDVLKREWDFSAPDKANFTFFHGLMDLTVTPEKALKFKIGNEGLATLGWGNYNNALPAEKRELFWKKSYLAFQVRQSGISHLRPGEQKRIQLGQSCQVRQSDIGDPGTGQVQPLESRQRFEVRQPGVGDLCVVQDQPNEFGQPFQVNDSGVGNTAASDV